AAVLHLLFASHHERDALGHDRKLIRSETGDCQGQPIGLFPGLLDVVRGISRLSLDINGLIEPIKHPIKADSRAEQRREIEGLHDRSPSLPVSFARPIRIPHVLTTWFTSRADQRGLSHARNASLVSD